MKRILICLSALLLLLCGCDSYRETNRLTIVSAGGVERANDDSVKLLVETVKLSQDSTTPEAALMTAFGDSVPSAFHNASLRMGTDLYWSHAQVIIIGQNLTRDGISPLLDYLSRNPEMRMSCRLITVKDAEAAELLTPSPLSGEVPGYDLGLLVTRGTEVGFSPDVPLYKLLDTLLSEGVDPVIPAVTMQGKQCMPYGCAIFQKDKLAGYLNAEETQTLVLLKDGLNGAPVTLDDGTVLRLKHAKTIITPKYENDKLYFDINIKSDARLETLGREGASELSKRAEQHLTLQVEKLIKTLQKDYHSDALGLGRAVFRDIPSLWKTIGTNWSMLYPDAECRVSVNVEITSNGLVKTRLGGKIHD